MVSNYIVKTDLGRIHNVVQNTLTYQIKSLVLSTLKDFFKQDTYYRYAEDQFGFNLTPDHTAMPLEAGLYDNITTRVCIEEAFRFEATFYPAIIVKAGGMSSTPISFNREMGSIQYQDTLFVDGYGNEKLIKTPKSYIFAGSWEGTVNIDILARDPRTRDDLVDIISLQFVDIYFQELQKEGLIITGVSTSGSSDMEDRGQKLHKDTISLKTRTQWRREIPISNTIDVINFMIEFGQIPNGIVAQNLTIKTQINLLDGLIEL